MSTATFLAFANQPAYELRGLATHSANRFTAAAAGQVLQALEAKSLGDAALVKAHLQRAQSYWVRSQETQADQDKRAIAKVAALRADGIGRNIEQPGVTHGGAHLSMGEQFVRSGQARAESAWRAR